MIYRIEIDGISIYDEDEAKALISPSCELELNAAGSAEFTIPAGHEYYDIPKLLTSDVEIFEGDESIFFGRITSIAIDFYNRKKITCEGALAFFNDSIQRPAEYDTGDFSIKEFFNILIENHNSQVPDNRKFRVGKVDIDQKFVYRKLDYDNTLSCLTDMCLNAEGGYFIIRRDGNLTFIDWVKDAPYTGDQPIQFGINLKDLEQTIDGTEIYTAIIPLGEENEQGRRATVDDVNNGFDFVEASADAIKTYGRITSVVEFSGVTDPEDLMDAAKKWLSDQQFDPLSITLNAAELAYIDPSYTNFKMGEVIHCTSEPNLIDKDFPIVKMSMNLDTATKEITIGTIAKRTLTEITKDSDSYGSGSSSGGSSSGGGGGGSDDGGGESSGDINNGTLTIRINSEVAATFSANQASDSNVNITVPTVEDSAINFNTEW